MSIQKGQRVVIFANDTVMNRSPQLVGQIGTVVAVPVHPVTWFKVEFDDKSVHTFRPSALKAIPFGATEPSDTITNLVAAAKHSATNYVNYREVNQRETKSHHSSTSHSHSTPTQTNSTAKEHITKGHNDNVHSISKPHLKSKINSRHGLDLLWSAPPDVYLDAKMVDSYIQSKKLDIQKKQSNVISTPGRGSAEKIVSIYNHPEFPNECIKELIDTVCSSCYGKKWHGGKFCWNEACVKSPIYWKLKGASGTHPSPSLSSSSSSKIRSEIGVITSPPPSFKDYMSAVQAKGALLPSNIDKIILTQENFCHQYDKSRTSSNLTDCETISPLLVGADGISHGIPDLKLPHCDMQDFKRHRI